MTSPPDLSATVLVVDDDPAVADAYAGQLRRRYAVRVAYGGEDALSQLDDDVDVVLLDRRMPDRSGDEVLTSIRDAGYPCRVAMVTGVEPDFDILEMGFDDYVLKPVDPERLEQTVERLRQLETYDRGLRELFSEVSKCAALESRKDRDELEGSPEYRALRSRIERLEDRLDAARARLPDDAVFRVALSHAARDAHRQH